ncbi:hypothetical protein ACFQ4U_06475 [Micrococcus antarcticus]
MAVSRFQICQTRALLTPAWELLAWRQVCKRDAWFRPGFSPAATDYVPGRRAKQQLLREHLEKIIGRIWVPVNASKENGWILSSSRPAALVLRTLENLPVIQLTKKRVLAKFWLVKRGKPLNHADVFLQHAKSSILLLVRTRVT